MSVDSDFYVVLGRQFESGWYNFILFRSLNDSEPGLLQSSYALVSIVPRTHPRRRVVKRNCKKKNRQPLGIVYGYLLVYILLLLLNEIITELPVQALPFTMSGLKQIKL